MMMPATIIAPTKTMKPAPSPASLPSRTTERSLICGAAFCSTLVRSVAACSQKPCTALPISGHSATESVGGGICRVPPCNVVAASLADSTSELPSRYTGTSRTASPISVSSVAARPSCCPR
ncbi:hypothetical protein FQZ97_895080 [compost metagenome]